MRNADSALIPSAERKWKRPAQMTLPAGAASAPAAHGSLSNRRPQPQMAPAEPSPAARAVCERFGAGGAQPVVALVGAFLDASPRWSLMRAALAGLPLLVRRLSAQRPEPFDGVCAEAMDAAAEFGHLEIVQWLHAHRTEGCTTDAMDMAAANGHLRVVQWLHANRSEGCTTNAMDFAAMNGHLHVVRWLHEHRREGCTRDAMNNAASRGHLDVMRWLHANRDEGCSKTALLNAVRAGHRPVARWLLLHQRRLCGARQLLHYYKTRREPRALADWLFSHSYLRMMLVDENEEDDEEEEQAKVVYDEQLRALVREAFDRRPPIAAH